MRKQKNPLQTEAKDSVVKVGAAQAGEAAILNAGAVNAFALEFDPFTAELAREGNDLTFAFDNGGSVTINGYFVANAEALPGFVLPDGSTPAVEEVLAELEDISPAAGPDGANNTQSGGSGEYADNAGDLIGGVDRLGSLGTSYWERATDAPEDPVDLSAFGQVPDAPGAPVLPPVTPPPPVPSGDYNARAIIYAQDTGQDNSVTTQYLDSNGNPVKGDPNLEFVDGDGENLVSWSYDSNGNLVFTLTDEGKDFLAANGSIDYIEILYRVTDKVTGETYTIQIVVPRDGQFDAEDLAKNGSRHAGPVGDEQLIHGEWHEGDSNTDRDYQSTSSNLDDSYVLNGVYAGTDIHTGYGDGNWGNDTVTINGDIDNQGGTVNIITGKGTDTVSLYGMYAEKSGETLIDTGREQGDRVDMIWKMHAEGTANDAGETSRNTIITGDLNIDSQINHGMYAANANSGKNPGGNNAENIVDAAGDVTISVEQFNGYDTAAMRANNQSQHSGHVSNSIKADGDVTLLANTPEDGATVVAGMFSETWWAKDHGTASNSIEADGKVRMDVKGGQGADVYGMFALNESTNSVKADTIDIDASGTGYVAGVQSSAKDGKTGYNSYTTGGKNILEGREITITAESSGGEANAIATGKHGSTEIKGSKDEANTFVFEAKGKSAYGVSTGDDGQLGISEHSTSITGGNGNDSITIRATADGTANDDGYAMGIYSGSTGHNIIDTGAGMDTVTVEARGVNGSYGMAAGTKKTGGWGGTDASNTIMNAEKVSILAESSGDDAYGLVASAGWLQDADAQQLGDRETGFNKIILGDDGTGNRELSVTARALGTGSDAGNAFGLWADNQASGHHNGYNLIQGSKVHGNSIKVEAESRGGDATGMYAKGSNKGPDSERGGNVIRGGDQADGITVNAFGATKAVGMQAGQNGSSIQYPSVNEIDSGLGKDTVTVNAVSTAAGSSATGVLAYSGGHNTLTAKDGRVEVNATSNGGDAAGLQATGNDALNTVTAREVAITATATGNGNAYGVLSKNAPGVSQYSSGDNTIDGTNVTITAKAEDGDAFGMLSHLDKGTNRWATAGTNTVTGDTITVGASGKGYVAGVQSSLRGLDEKADNDTGGKNVLEGKDISVSAKSTGGTANGVATGRDGETVITGENIRIIAESDGNKANGIYSMDTGKTVIEGNDIHVSATSNGEANAVESWMNGVISINGKQDQDNKFLFEATGKNAYGVSSSDAGAGQGMGQHGLTITGGDKDDVVTIRATGTGSNYGEGFAMGMYAGSTGHTVIDTGKGVDAVVVEAKGNGNSFGMAAGSTKQGGMGGSDASNTIVNAEKITILGESKNGAGYGMFASPGTSSKDIFNKIILGDDGEGDRELTVTGRALGSSAAYGMAARSYVSNANSKYTQGQNIIEGSKTHGNSIRVEAESAEGCACGMIAYGEGSAYGGANIIKGGDKADSITVSATAATLAVGMQAGMDKKSAPALNKIDSGLGDDTVTISAEATGDGGSAAGMLAYKNGENSITSAEGTVTVNVHADGEALGMGANGSGARNSITASEVSLDITSDTGVANGMLAQSGGVNTIRASDDGITVVIKVVAGSADQAYAMYASGGGKNEIIGSAKADSVDITGGISGNNVIDTGAGDDMISLNGKVSGLVLKAGDGHDLLILKADDAKSFTENYQSWLEGLSDAELRSMSIEEIWVNGQNGADWMHDPEMSWFWQFVDKYNDVTGNNVLPESYSSVEEGAMASLAYSLDEEEFLDLDTIADMQAYLENAESDSLPSGLPVSLPGELSDGDGGALASLKSMGADLLDMTGGELEIPPAGVALEHEAQAEAPVAGCQEAAVAAASIETVEYAGDAQTDDATAAMLLMIQSGSM